MHICTSKVGTCTHTKIVYAFKRLDLHKEKTIGVMFIGVFNIGLMCTCIQRVCWSMSTTTVRNRYDRYIIVLTIVDCPPSEEAPVYYPVLGNY